MLVHDLVQLGGQRAERLVGFDDLGDDLRGLGGLHQRGVNPAEPRGQAGDRLTQLLDVGDQAVNVAVEPELLGDRLPLPVQFVEFLVLLLKRGQAPATNAGEPRASGSRRTR